MFKETIVKIKNKLNQAEHYQSLLRAFELRDRSIMEANFERVNFWSVVNLVIMISVCLIQVRSNSKILYDKFHCQLSVIEFFQVFMIRSLFEDRSKIGKLLRHPKNFN